VSTASFSLKFHQKPVVLKIYFKVYSAKKLSYKDSKFDELKWQGANIKFPIILLEIKMLIFGNKNG